MKCGFLPNSTQNVYVMLRVKGLSDKEIWDDPRLRQTPEELKDRAREHYNKWMLSLFD